jgi:hypothetical protein
VSVAVNVPRSCQKGLSLIADASPLSASALVNLLSKMSPTILNDEGLEEFYDGTIDGISKSEFRSIVQAIGSLHSGQLTVDVKRDEFLRDILSSEFVSGMTDAQQSNLGERLPALFSIKALFISAKAVNVMFDTPAHFTGVRILTDLRPVFDRSDANTIEAAVITHTLRLNYHGTEREELFLAVDSNDLDRIQDAIVRAREKAKAIESAVTKSGITILKVPKA